MLTRGLTFAAGFLLCGSIASLIKAPENLKPIALNFLLMSGTAIAVNEFAIYSASNEVGDQENKFREEIKTLTKAKAKVEDDYSSQTLKIRELSATIETQLKDIALRDDAVRTMQLKIAEYKAEHTNALQQLKAKLKADDTRFGEALSEFKEALIGDIEPRIDSCYSGLQKDSEQRLEGETLIKFRAKLQVSYENCIELCEHLREADDLLEAIDIIFDITTKLASIKVQYRNTLNVGERLQLEKAFELLGDNDEKLQVFKQFKDAYFNTSDKHKSDLEEFLYKVSDSKNSLAEMREQVNDLINELEKRNLKINTLTAEVEELRKPIQFLGSSDYAQAGNSISLYYYKNYGYRLDCINWSESQTGYTITFAIRKNQGLTIDELYVKNSREQLAAFTNALAGTLPEFELNYQHGLATLTVQQRKAFKKELDAVDIFRECDVIRADKFGAVIQQHHIDKGGLPTLRVMTATGQGKGIAVKNLVDYYTKHVDGYEIWLSDPMNGSSEDYWQCPKVATDEDSAQEIFANFARVYGGRHTKTSTEPKTPILGIFDEFDKQHSKEDKKTASEIWTAIRHQSMRLILVGQCAEVGKNGWTWQDMDNCALLFIGKAITTFIKHADKDLGMSAEALDKFSARYNKINKWVHDKNQEIEEIENHYRIAALYVSGKAMLLEIPYALKAPITSGKSWLVSKPFEQKMSINTQYTVIPNSSEWVEIQPENQFLTSPIVCPHCGSENLTRKGKTPTGKQQYQCKDCGKRPSF